MKGFTLIELLVVVLIIGILSAIALPQYELVVEKSRASEAMVNAKAIQDSCQRHDQEFPEHGGACNTKARIADVQLKGGSWNAGNTTFTTNKFVYTLGNSNFTVCRTDNGGTSCLYTITYPNLPPSNTADSGVSSGSCTGTDYEQVCKLFTDL